MHMQVMFRVDEQNKFKKINPQTITDMSILLEDPTVLGGWFKKRAETGKKELREHICEEIWHYISHLNPSISIFLVIFRQILKQIQNTCPGVIDHICCDREATECTVLILFLYFFLTF